MQKLNIHMTERPLFFKRRFDFEVGYLKESPCRRCVLRANLPVCSNQCSTLNHLQDLLAQTLSCSKFKD